MRFGYDGAPFVGWARQPGLRTVEGEILRGLVRLGIAPSEASARLSVSSRTDRGVSARGNTAALSSEIPSEALLRALNGIDPAIRFTRLARIRESYRPRSATQRWYRYWEREARRVPLAWRSAGRRLEGRIDVRSFARGPIPSDGRFRTIDSVRPSISHGWLVLDVRAPSFAWGMVRKIVAALRAVESGALDAGALEEAIEGHRRLSLPLAEPERLVLMETSHPVRWEKLRTGRTDHQIRRTHSELALASARLEVLAALEERPGSPRARGGPSPRSAVGRSGPPSRAPVRRSGRLARA